MISDKDKQRKAWIWKKRLISFLALFASSGTLFCCALPAAIAVIAGGAAVGSLVAAFPWLIPFSRHKDWIFLAAGLLLLLNGALLFRPEGKVACTITGGNGCEVAGRFTKVIFWISVVIIGIGAFFAYAIVPILRWLEA
jgi:hypothetical protein